MIRMAFIAGFLTCLVATLLLRKRQPRTPAQPDRPATEDAKWDKHTANLNSIYAEEKAVDKLRSRR